MVEVDLRGLLTRIAIRRQTATAEEITSEGINGFLFLSLFLCFCSLVRQGDMKDVRAKESRFCSLRTHGICSGSRTGCNFLARDTRALQSRSALQLARVKRVALAEIACLVAAAEPAGALFGRPVGK